MKQKSLKEEFSVLRSSSPYKIRRDKGFVQDAGPQLNQRYLLNKAMEINNFYERQRMFGEFDKLEPLFVDLFKQISYIREFLEKQLSQPLINKKQSSTIKKIAKKLDRINDIISSEILDDLDNLGAAKEEENPEDTFGMKR
jgi:hypothetical protein